MDIERLDRTVVSVGGNALTGGKGRETVPDQQEAARTACGVIAKIFRSGSIALTHGNGPQVGFIDRRFQFANKAGVLHPVPLDAVVADTQGAIGYMMEQMLGNELIRLGREEDAERISTLVTRVLVDGDDPAFSDPSKPIGSWMSGEEAEKLAKVNGWKIREMDANREDGWRRVVASPEPKSLLNETAILKNIIANLVTICGGGGGVPVVKNVDGTYSGVEAVIDKDLTTVLVAKAIYARVMIILTGAPGVIDPVEFAKNGANGQVMRQLQLAEAKDMLSQLQAGSMGPKVAACVQFVEETGYPAIIANFENAEDAIKGDAGTTILAEPGSKKRLPGMED